MHYKPLNFAFKTPTLFFFFLFLFSSSSFTVIAQTIEAQTSKEIGESNIDSLTNASSMSSFPYHKHQLGFSFSMFSGYGLSYRYLPSEKILIKLTAFGFSHSIDKPSIPSEFTETTITFGAELHYTLRTFESTRFYLLAGFSRFYEQKANRFTGGSNRVTSSMEDWTMGLGVGSEFKIVSRFFLNLDLGFSFAPSSTFNESGLPQNRNSSFFGFSAGAGFSYGF